MRDDIPPPSAMPWVVNPAPPGQVSSFFPMAEPARSTPPPTIVEEVTVPRAGDAVGLDGTLGRRLAPVRAACAGTTRGTASAPA